MEQPHKAFGERVEEINAYLSLLEAVEAAARAGPPRVGDNGQTISAQQQKILYAGVFLHLYNLVEATVFWCMDSVTHAPLASSEWRLGDLSDALKKEWVRAKGKTHIDLNYERRLQYALEMCGHLVDVLPILGFKIDRGKGGTWDDNEIEKVAKRVGLNITVSPDAYAAVKRKFRDELGPLELVARQRNYLAHGTISFAECGENLTVAELQELSTHVQNYMSEVVQAFETFVRNHEFLAPDKRPVSASS